MIDEDPSYHIFYCARRILQEDVFILPAVTHLAGTVSNCVMGHCLQLVAECIKALLPNILSGNDHSSIFMGFIGTTFKDGAMESGVSETENM